MSIYSTLWILKFPKEGDLHGNCEWIEVLAQAVPAHIGDGEDDPYSSFLPPPIEESEDLEIENYRAVVFVTELTVKGTDNNSQEYQSPLLIMSGEEYLSCTFSSLHDALCDSLRGNRKKILAEVFNADGTSRLIRESK